MADKMSEADAEGAREAVSELLEGVASSMRDGVLLVVYALYAEVFVEPGVSYREAWVFKSAKEALSEITPALRAHHLATRAGGSFCELGGRASLWKASAVRDGVSDACAAGLRALGARWVLCVAVRGDAVKGGQSVDELSREVGEGLRGAAERLGGAGPARAPWRVEDSRVVESDLTDGLVAMMEAQAIGAALPKAEVAVARASLKL